ncbi:hypothetical protein DP939_18985 [Spongiactinospora rosea]|uniref:TrbL/VirB6 plasmid conjugal transfer protein n=2 Tax=Spongiactinospora rosea TaxID=2248750 RepID=A0A366LYY2_9ACTN|nr:hypothetical protein DP939_18985 [Spongiactinospora rosea]
MGVLASVLTRGRRLLGRTRKAPGAPGRKARRGRRIRKAVGIALIAFVGLVAVPFAVPTTASAAVPICDLSPDLAPEIVGGGVDGLLQPPPPGGVPPVGQGPAPTPQPAPPPPPEPGAQTNYGAYGMAGLYWHTHDLGCDDVVAVLGNAWSNMIFTLAKAVDRLTITTYQAAATEGPLQSIKDVVDDVVTNLANAMYWPYLRPLVILGAIWLAWYGLIRKRATTTAEGVIWMVLAVTVAVWFFSRPGDFTGVGKVVTDKTAEVVNSAFSGLPGAGGASCLPPKGTPATQAMPQSGGYGQGGTAGVEQNADALWSTLACKPWLMGMFGTADPNAPVVRDFGALMLDIQAIDRQEQLAEKQPAASAHQKRYEEEVVKQLNGTSIYPLLSGHDWTSRLGISLGALIAAMVAGLLIFLVAVSLLVLKVGFLLLLILAPIFLLIGVHPGSGRIIALRWLEMVIGTLLRQAVLALVLGVLVYGYALIISTAMPWGMQILFIALLTIAVFFYRRPFQHLFASMDGHTLTTRMLGEAASAPSLSRAANVLPPVAGYRVGRWGMRKAEPLIQAAAMASGGAATAAAAAVAQGKVRGEEGAAQGGASGTRVPVAGQPAPLDTEGSAGARRKAGTSRTTLPRTGSAPPLDLSGKRPAGTPVRGGRTGGTPSVSGSGTSGGSGGSGGRGGWFSGRSGGGWARGGSSGSGSAGRTSGGRSGGGLFGGGGSGRSSNGGSSGRGSSSGGSSGGGLFGGNGGASRRSGGSAGGSGRGPAARGGGDGGRRAEAPPLWLSGGGGRSGDEPDVPFWLRPSRHDKD